MGFFGDLLKGVGSVLGVTSKVASPWSAAIGSLGNLIGNQESSAEAEQARQEQNDLNAQYLEHLKRTNEQNYRMFQEQNQYNAQAATTAFQHQMTLQRDQQSYNTQMWNANNAYNSPEQQRERWEAAGFSPWTLATGGTGAGGLSSAPSSGQGSAPQARAGTPVPAQAGSPLSSPRVISMGLAIDAQEQSITQQSKFLETISSTRDHKLKEEAQRSLSRLQESQSAHMEALVGYLGAKKEEQDVINKYLDDNQLYKLQLLIRQYNNEVIRSNLMSEDLDRIASEIRKNNAQARSIEIENEADWRLLENYIAARLSSYILEEFENDQTFEYFMEHPEAYKKLIGAETSYSTYGPLARFFMDLLGLVPKFIRGKTKGSPRKGMN